MRNRYMMFALGFLCFFTSRSSFVSSSRYSANSNYLSTLTILAWVRSKGSCSGVAKFIQGRFDTPWVFVVILGNKF